MTINARSEDDVEESVILDKVSKSSGSNYSFHKEKAVPLEEPKPVSSVYKRTMAAAEIKGKNRDEFWDKLEVKINKASLRIVPLLVDGIW